MMPLPIVAAAAAVALSLWPHVAAAQTPSRDGARAVTPSNAVVSGVVLVDGGVPTPLRRATVSLFGPGVPMSTITDDAGRFLFVDVPVGAYTVMASRASYVSGAYGATRPGGSGVPVEVVAGGGVTGLTITLLRGGVITGTIRQPDGLPVVGSELTLFRVTSRADGRQGRPVVVTTGVVTDGRGRYRIYGLAPGRYVVRVQTPPRFGPGDLRQTTAAEAAWARARAGSAAAAGPPPSTGRAMGYVPTFYPGTAELSGALPVTVTAGGEVSGIDFTVAFVPMSSVSGVVLGGDGQPVRNATIQLAAGAGDPNGDLVDTLLALGASGARATYFTDADGRFSMGSVPPGQYRLRARARGVWADADLALAGEDVTGLTLTLAAGVTLRGRMVYDGANEAPGRARLSLSEAGPDDSPVDFVSALMRNLATMPAPDGSFVIDGVVPGPYRVQALPPGVTVPTPGLVVSNGWTVKSITLDGRDVTDAVVAIGPAPPGELVVTFTNRLTGLSGTVLTPEGLPVSAFPIVVFATAREQWGVWSRRIAYAKPSASGRYQVDGLPPGDYYVAAVSDLDLASLFDPEFLEAMRAGAFIVRLDAGERKVQDLRIGG